MARRKPSTSDPWEVFLNEIRKAQRQLKCTEFWYRGHTQLDHKLVPSLLRYKNGLAKERLLFEKFEQAAASLKMERASAWETLFDMQHYYIPTRLLDWSEVLGVAVFFAILRDTGTDSCVYVLNPKALNLEATGASAVKRRDVKDFDYKKVYWQRDAAILPSRPIAMEPDFQNPRILAQKGKFTIHNDNPAPLDEQCPSCVKRVVLPYSARSGAREFLQFANLNQFSVFPDMVGIAPFIRDLAELD
jgi:hypothetical protein